MEAEYWSLSGWMTLAIGFLFGIHQRQAQYCARAGSRVSACSHRCHCQNLDVATTPEAIENSKITVNEFIG